LVNTIDRNTKAQHIVALNNG